jgi:hypothetical protein
MLKPMSKQTFTARMFTCITLDINNINSAPRPEPFPQLPCFEHLSEIPLSGAGLKPVSCLLFPLMLFGGRGKQLESIGTVEGRPEFHPASQVQTCLQPAQSYDSLHHHKLDPQHKEGYDERI